MKRFQRVMNLLIVWRYVTLDIQVLMADTSGQFSQVCRSHSDDCRDI